MIKLISSCFPVVLHQVHQWPAAGSARWLETYIRWNFTEAAGSQQPSCVEAHVVQRGFPPHGCAGTLRYHTHPSDSHCDWILTHFQMLGVLYCCCFLLTVGKAQIWAFGVEHTVWVQLCWFHCKCGVCREALGRLWPQKGGNSATAVQASQIIGISYNYTYKQ